MGCCTIQQMKGIHIDGIHCNYGGGDYPWLKVYLKMRS